MKTIKKKVFSISLMILCSLIGISQQTKVPDTSVDKIKLAAREIMISSGTCTLITLDENMLPTARVMDPFAPESDFAVWFGTNQTSRKVSQIKKNSTVTLFYLDSDASGYVVIQGNAELIRDPMEKEARWKEEWQAFYPNRPEGYLLIKVTPKWMEVISNSRGIFGDSKTWQPSRIVLDSN